MVTTLLLLNRVLLLGGCTFPWVALRMMSRQKWGVNAADCKIHILSIIINYHES